MIYIVEITPQGRANAWFAFGKDDFQRKVHATKQRAGWTIFERTTPRQLLSAVGKEPDSTGAREVAPQVFALAEQCGWDGTLHRADYLVGHDVYQVEAVDEFDACLAAVSHDLQTCRVYYSDEEAVDALYRDPLYNNREGLRAHIALREELIAQEAMADDL
jgi:hypothetical protein